MTRLPLELFPLAPPSSPSTCAQNSMTLRQRPHVANDTAASVSKERSKIIHVFGGPREGTISLTTHEQMLREVAEVGDHDGPSTTPELDYPVPSAERTHAEQDRVRREARLAKCDPAKMMARLNTALHVRKL